MRLERGCRGCRRCVLQYNSFYKGVVVLYEMAELYVVDRNGISYIGKGSGAGDNPLMLESCVSVLTEDLIVDPNFEDNVKKAYLNGNKELIPVRIDGLTRVIHFVRI